MALAGREPALGVQGGHRARACGRDGLAVGVVDDVAGGEDALAVGLGRAGLRHQVARLVVVELVEEELGVRVVADGDEQAVRRQLARLVGVEVAQPHGARLSVLGEHLVDDVRRDELDLLVVAGAVEHDLRGPEVVAPVNQADLGGELRQEDRLLHRRVAAADDHDLLVAEEGRVADRAVRDAAALQRALGLEPELPGGRAGGDDHALGGVLVLADPDPQRVLGEVDLRHVVGQELRAEALGLAPEVLHHRRAHDPVGIARIVLDVARDHQLAAPGEALDHERLQVGARGVERGRVPGRASADDDEFSCVPVHFCLRSIKRIGSVKPS